MKEKHNLTHISQYEPKTSLDYTDLHRHTSSLLRASAEYYKNGNLIRAWELIDRYCRVTSKPKVSDYVYRAQILHQLGRKTLALKDIESALKLEPESIDANRRLLAWSSFDIRKKAAALNLLRSSNDHTDLEEAGGYLMEYQKLDGLIRLHITELSIKLEVIRIGAIFLNLTITSPSDKAKIIHEIQFSDKENNRKTANERYYLDCIEHKWTQIPSSIEITARHAHRNEKVLKSAKIYVVEHEALKEGDETIRPQTTWSRNRGIEFNAIKCRSQDTASKFPIVLIIPVYKDFISFSNCITSIMKSCNNSKLVVLIINDATPEREIRKSLDTIRASQEDITVIENNENLGFVCSINIGLRYAKNIYPNSDVILLNSDTEVPPGFADHLLEAAYISTDIGTVTPLSNNGEYTSFPIPFVANSELDYQQIRMLDSMAYRGEKVVEDIPSGIGFCLYIKIDCLNAVGMLDETITDGYLEDLDFSMRTRENGLRNVCSANVFVGHCGARSFTTRKRALVMRNMKVLEAKYPHHAEESAAFVATDPLFKHRQKLEACAIRKKKFQSIIIHSTNVSEHLLISRVLDKKSVGPNVLLVETSTKEFFKLRDPDGGVPQSLECNLSSLTGLKLMISILNDQNVARCELIDISPESELLLEICRRYGIHFNIFISRTTYQTVDLVRQLKPFNKSTALKISTAKGNQAQCDYNRNTLRKKGELDRTANGRKSRILPIDERAHSDVLKISKSEDWIVDKSKMWSRPPKQHVAYTASGIINLALVDVKGGIEELTDLITLAKELTKKKFDYRVVVFGSTYHDLSIMKCKNFFVKGPICISEYEEQFEIHNINSVLSLPRSRLYYEDYDLAFYGSRMPYARFSYPSEYVNNDDNGQKGLLTSRSKNPNDAQREPEITLTRSSPNLSYKATTAVGYTDDIILPCELPSTIAAAELVIWLDSLNQT